MTLFQKNSGLSELDKCCSEDELALWIEDLICIPGSSLLTNQSVLLSGVVRKMVSFLGKCYIIC